MAKAKWRTASEIMAERQQDPEYVAMRARKDAEYEAAKQRSREDQALILADLRRLGYHLETVWNFVNTTESYPDAIPVLLDHIRRPYAPVYREGMARALTVREGRGTVGPTMVALLQSPDVDDPSLRWALANALTIVATRAEKNDIEALIAAEPAGEVQKRLMRALKTAAKP